MKARLISGKPAGKPRGKGFQKGQSGNPSGKGSKTPEQRKIEMDARLYARQHGIEAVKKMAAIMRDETATHSAQLTAAIGLLDRGWGRPPQAVEIYGGDVRPEERAGSALEILEGKLAELERREQEAGGPLRLN